MRGSRIAALIALYVFASPVLPQGSGASSWHLVDGGSRLVYGAQSGDPVISLGCGPMASVEVWIADPRGSYRAKGLKVVTLTALHGVENRAIRHDTYRSGVDAIVYTVDASSLMWTALLMDRGFSLYNAPERTRIPGDWASQLVRDFLPSCFAQGRGQTGGDSPAPKPATPVALRGQGADPNAMPDVVAHELTATYKACKRSNVGTSFVNHRDVNGDGLQDWWLDYAHYDCGGAADFCGSAGCVIKVYASSPGGYAKVFDDNAYKISFSSTGGRHRMIVDLHGSFCERVGAARCRKVMTWNGKTFAPSGGR